MLLEPIDLNEEGARDLFITQPISEIWAGRNDYHYTCVLMVYEGDPDTIHKVVIATEGTWEHTDRPLKDSTFSNRVKEVLNDGFQQIPIVRPLELRSGLLREMLLDSLI